MATDPIHIKKSHEGKVHEWAKVPNGQEIPMSKIKQGERSPDPAVRKEAHFADNAPHWNHKGRAMTVTATAKGRRRHAKLDRRFEPKMREKATLGVKNTFLGKTSRKKYRRVSDRHDQVFR